MSAFGKLGVSPEQNFAKCERCGAIPYSTFSLCRRCRRRSTAKTAIAVVIAAEAVFAAGVFLLPHTTTNPPAPLALAAALPSTAAAGGWNAFDTHDAVRNELTHHTTLSSLTPRDDARSPDLQGLTAATLEIVTSRTGGKSVTFSFVKSATPAASARAAQRCAIRAAFDETQPINFVCQDKSVETSAVLQLTDFDRFTQRLAVSHDLTVIADVGAKHPSVMRFTVAGYDTAANVTRMIIRLAALQSPAARPYPE
jgi:hypothetical protein